MDKRTLLFMVCISLAFFGVHTWFGMDGAKERKAYELKIQEQKIAKQKDLEAQSLARTARLEELPLISLYADANGQEKIATGLSCQGLYLTFAWQQVLPNQVYLSRGNSFESLQLAAPALQTGDLVIYSAPEATAVTLPGLPLDRPTDLQLIAMGPELRVVLGEQRGDECKLPFHYLGERAFAVLKSENNYLPVGVYEPATQKIKPLKDFERLTSLVKQIQSAPLTPPASGESFYVLENSYQQLVFSTRGGSLAEINLPMNSDKDSKSLIKEIDIDRIITSTSPQNAHFPLHSFYTPDQVLHGEGSLGGYYPLLRRPIVDASGREKNPFSAEYYALNIVSEDPELANLNYRVTRFEANLIQFEASTAQRRIVKTFTIPQDRNGPYCFQLDVRIDGDAQGLWLSSGIPDAELVGGSYSPLLKLQLTRNHSSDVEEIDLPKKGPVQVFSLSPNWISNSNGFLGLIVDPLKEIGQGYKVAQIDGNRVPTRLSLVDPAYNLYPAAQYPGYETYLPLKSGENLPFRIFAGPYDSRLLKELDAIYEDPSKNYNPEYALAQSIQGWFSFISQPFAKFLFFLMQLFYSITHSWAFSIILLTVALKAMMYPLNAWSIRSSMRMQEIAPKVKIIQDRNKKDPKKAQMEIMNLYRESGVNPMTGCFPVLLQMPFLIGMFYLLKSSFQLRGAVFIPGWIDDLAAPDVLFSWGQPVWFFGNQLHLLPILMGLTMFLQQRLTSKLPKDASQLNDAQKQQKMMGNMMSVLFAVMFYNFPSGLNIYFMLSTLLGILQQWWMMKTMKPNPAKGL
jgi:YidC/Oxa1 family membrane protein insertase